MDKNRSFWPLSMVEKNFWPAMRFELCTPVLNRVTSSNFSARAANTSHRRARDPILTWPFGFGQNTWGSCSLCHDGCSKSKRYKYYCKWVDVSHNERQAHHINLSRSGIKRYLTYSASNIFFSNGFAAWLAERHELEIFLLFVILNTFSVKHVMFIQTATRA